MSRYFHFVCDQVTASLQTRKANFVLKPLGHFEMSRRCFYIVQNVSRRFLPFPFREYVASKEEVEKYVQSKKRAIEWLAFSGIQPRWRYPSDHVAIHRALKHHLFNPIPYLPEAPADPVLPLETSLSALNTAHQMLQDLESYLTSRNVVRFAERVARIVAFSKEGIWKEHCTPFVIRLALLVDLGLPRFNRAELGLLVWSFGKFGPEVLNLHLGDDGTVHNLVLRMMDRIGDESIKGEFDNSTASNFLNGCIQLKLSPKPSLSEWMERTLKGTIEFADGQTLTRLIVSFAQLKLEMDPDFVRRSVETMNGKIKAGNYPIKEVPLMIWSLGHWLKGGSQPLIQLAQSADSFVLKQKEIGWSLRHRQLILEGFLNLRYFPSWSFLERMTIVAKEKDASSVSIWISMLSVFAEFGVRPNLVLERCRSFLERWNGDASNVSDVCSLLRSYAILSILTVEDFVSAFPKVSLHSSVLSPQNKSAVYQAFLHFKYFLGDVQASEKDSGFLNACQEAWRMEERQRAGHLRRTAIEKLHKIETADGDVVALITNNDSDTIVENPDCFLNTRGRILGSQLWRKRLLQNLNPIFKQSCQEEAERF